MDAIWLALIAVASPLLMAWLTDHLRRKENVENYARQDKVAADLVARQDRIAAKAEETARLLKKNTEDAVTARAETSDQLKEIHTLVNSSMTAALQAELDSTKRELAALLEIGTLKKASGKKPGVNALAVITATKARIGELESVLADRKKQTTLAAAAAARA